MDQVEKDVLLYVVEVVVGSVPCVVALWYWMRPNAAR